MTLLEDFNKRIKDFAYEKYIRITDGKKDYEKITRRKMSEEIIKEFNQENYFYNYCTTKELIVLELIYNNEEKIDCEKYKYELKHLEEKLVIYHSYALKMEDREYNIYEDMKEYVKNSINTFNKCNRVGISDDVFACAVGIVKAYGTIDREMLFDTLKEFLNGKEEYLEQILNSPAFNYYCMGYYKEVYGTKREYIDFWDYIDILDDIEKARKENCVSSLVEINYQNYIDIFYYGFPIHISEVKKMYDILKEKSFVLDNLVKDANVMGLENIKPCLSENFRNIYDLSDEEIDIINEGLYNSLSPSYGGLSPKQAEEELDNQINIYDEFQRVTQDYAHINSSQRDDFFKYTHALMNYVNMKYKINEKVSFDRYFNMVFDRSVSPYEFDGYLYELLNYVWDNPKEIEEYVKENPDNFKEKELEEIMDIRNNYLKSDNLIIVGYERNHTLILNENKIYKVKGISKNIDKLIDKDNIPALISTTLVEFRGTIIYDGSMLDKSGNLMISSGFMKEILKETKKAKVCDSLKNI